MIYGLALTRQAPQGSLWGDRIYTPGMNILLVVVVVLRQRG